MTNTQRTVGILFDLDGVLWDTSAIHERAFLAVCKTEGLEPVDYRALAGRTTRSAWKEILSVNGRQDDARTVDRLVKAKQSLSREWIREAPPLSAEISRVLALRERDHLLGLVTGSSEETVGMFLESSGLVFDAVITGTSVSPGKPAGQPYIAAANVLGIEVERCWALEDSRQGLESATAAGARAVHLRCGSGACDTCHPLVKACVLSIADYIDLAIAEEPTT